MKQKIGYRSAFTIIEVMIVIFFIAGVIFIHHLLFSDDKQVNKQTIVAKQNIKKSPEELKVIQTINMLKENIDLISQKEEEQTKKYARFLKRRRWQRH